MQELRWILLLVGVLFLIVLAAWEMLRARRAAAPREPFPHLGRDLPQEPALGESADAGAAVAEPIRAQRGGLPLIDLPQMSAVRVELAGNASPEAVVSASVEPEPESEPEIEPEIEPELEPESELEPELRPDSEPEFQPRFEPEPQFEAAAPATAAEPPAATPSLDWPPEGERQILSVRIVSSGEQRLSGRAIRQALAACGFMHGRYRIFHQPAEDGRVLLSCASLNKPGNFDPASMDFQHYSGVSVFTVLPGPLPAVAALERLIEAGRDLSQRLQARLLDERGELLDSTRIAALRAAVAAASGMAVPGAAGTASRTAASAVGAEPRA